MTNIDWQIRKALIVSRLKPKQLKTYFFISLCLFCLFGTIQVTRKKLPRCLVNELCIRDTSQIAPRFEYKLIFTPLEMLWTKLSLVATAGFFLFKDDIKKRMAV